MGKSARLKREKAQSNSFEATTSEELEKINKIIEIILRGKFLTNDMSCSEIMYIIFCYDKCKIYSYHEQWSGEWIERKGSSNGKTLYKWLLDIGNSFEKKKGYDRDWYYFPCIDERERIPYRELNSISIETKTRMSNDGTLVTIR